MSGVRVAPDAGGWVVTLDGSEAPLVTFRLESDAVMYGRDYARRNNLTLTVHFPDGMVRFIERPIPPKPAG